MVKTFSNQFFIGIILVFKGYIGEFEIIDDHRSGKIVVNLNGRLNKVFLTKKINLF